MNSTAMMLEAEIYFDTFTYQALYILSTYIGRSESSSSSYKWLEDSDGSYKRVKINTTVSLDPNPNIEYLGCFKDHLERVFPDRVDELIRRANQFAPRILITPSSCSEICSNRGQPYSAVEYHSQCYCSNVPPPEHERAGSDAECDAKCLADQDQTCGGTWRMSVYYCE